MITDDLINDVLDRLSPNDKIGKLPFLIQQSFRIDEASVKRLLQSLNPIIDDVNYAGDPANFIIGVDSLYDHVASTNAVHRDIYHGVKVIQGYAGAINKVTKAYAEGCQGMSEAEASVVFHQQSWPMTQKMIARIALATNWINDWKHNERTNLYSLKLTHIQDSPQATVSIGINTACLIRMCESEGYQEHEELPVGAASALYWFNPSTDYAKINPFDHI